MKKNYIILTALLFLMSINSYGQDIFANYRVHFDKIYLTNYVQTENDNLKIKRVGDLTYEITSSGNFKIHDEGNITNITVMEVCLHQVNITMVKKKDCGKSILKADCYGKVMNLKTMN